MGLGFRQKTGLKTKPRQRNKFFGKLIICLSLGFRQKPASKLNLAREIISRGINYLSEFTRSPKPGLKN